MDIRINHACPSCGAPVEMKEVDRLTSCVFCETQSYLVDTGLLRFVLPDSIPEHIPREDIIYFPYLRFKGNIYICQGREVAQRVLDATHQGLDVRLMPPSLGLRPQAMKVNLVNDSHLGKFIRRKETAVTIMQRASLLAENFSDLEDGPLYHRAFIGETVSCIYQPLYIEDGKVYDGVLNRSIGRSEPWLSDKKTTVRYRPEWQFKFLATICPQCGASMHGSHDSLILNCYNCDSCWAEKGGKFVRVPHTLIGSAKPNTMNLPFWRITAEATGTEIRTLADLLRVTNQPVVINKTHEERALEFWIPAIKVRPKTFLKLAKNATLSQIRFPEGNKRLYRPLHPVTLPLKEAIQILKCLVAETTVNRKDVLPQLPNLSFSIKRTALTYLPFEDTGHDFVQEHSALSVAVSVVRFGRKL